MKELNNLPTALEEIMAKDSQLDERIREGLELIYKVFDAKNCTLHSLNEDGSFLSLVGQIGLPEKIAEIAKIIPVGKGMAGVCAQKKEPVTMCNLQTDDSGVARPSAKDTEVEGAVVVPLLNDNEEVIATLGVGKSGEHDYSEEEIDSLNECGQILMSSTPQ